MSTQTFDPIWNELYGCGEGLNKYPWDAVVSFVFRNYPRNKAREEVRILEIGCGTASNLWFAAREGFQVAGVDGSISAIEFARKRFADEGLVADLRVADFTSLPFADETFDLVIDRAALSCCGLSAAKAAVSEVRRILVPRGRFFCNPYSDTHGSRVSGRPVSDGLTIEISNGTLAGVGQLCFYDQAQLEQLFSAWTIRSFCHLEMSEVRAADRSTHSEWRVIAEK